MIYFSTCNLYFHNSCPSLSLCPRRRNKIDLFIYFIYLIWPEIGEYNKGVLASSCIHILAVLAGSCIHILAVLVSSCIHILAVLVSSCIHILAVLASSCIHILDVLICYPLISFKQCNRVVPQLYLNHMICIILYVVWSIECLVEYWLVEVLSALCMDDNLVWTNSKLYFFLIMIGMYTCRKGLYTFNIKNCHTNVIWAGH